MSELNKFLRAEHDRLEEQKAVYEDALSALPKGYISKKNIRGTVSYYLQWRENGKLISKYIPKDNVSDIKSKIALRKQLKEYIQGVTADLNRLRKALR